MHIPHQPDETGVCDHGCPRCKISVKIIFYIMSYVSHSLCVLFKYINLPQC